VNKKLRAKKEEQAIDAQKICSFEIFKYNITVTFFAI